MTSRKVAVLGASEFVGSAIAGALATGGYEVLPIRAPRLPAMSTAEGTRFLESLPPELHALTEQLHGMDAVVNAAGRAGASSADSEALIAANGVLPGMVAAASVAAGVPRMVHVSSAAVQGRAAVLDAGDVVDPFSPYARSKILGERLARRHGGENVVVYRPPGVHGADRDVTRAIVRVAVSPVSSVARPGTDPSPQALIDNVAGAVAFLATTALRPPAVVIHPWEGLTTTDVLTLLGGTPPHTVPRVLARAAVSALALAGRVAPTVAANARRAEMLWFGQRQAESWLTQAGWVLPVGRDGWERLGQSLREERNRRE